MGGEPVSGGGRAVSRVPLSSDLKDMSPMVLTCDGPDRVFDKHGLVLNVPFSDSKRVGVFCARGEWPGGASSCPAPSSAPQTLSSFVHVSPCLPSPFVTHDSLNSHSSIQT